MINFHARCVSHKIITYSCLHLCQKWLLMWFILSGVLERMVRLLTVVDVMLEQQNVKSVLSMISLTSINTVCSFSKWLQNKRGACPSPPPPAHTRPLLNLPLIQLHCFVVMIHRKERELLSQCVVSGSYSWKQLHDWLKTWNNQYVSKMTSNSQYRVERT